LDFSILPLVIAAVLNDEKSGPNNRTKPRRFPGIAIARLRTISGNAEAEQIKRKAMEVRL
jgi:hypothetical protein